MANWSPNENEVRYLANIEVGGQALVPCLVWDALRIPCALVGQVFADDIGTQIVDRVAKTEWIDFEWMMSNQRVPESESLEHGFPKRSCFTKIGAKLGAVALKNP